MRMYSKVGTESLILGNPSQLMTDSEYDVRIEVLDPQTRQPLTTCITSQTWIITTKRLNKECAHYG